jgi:signal transduction histidine kinase
VTCGTVSNGTVSNGAAASGDTTVRLGRGHLEQVLDNVFANALEALPDGGRVQVHVEVAPPDGRVRLRVIDDGPGMDARAKAAAFHRFANQEARGNGLGLAIVYRLVSADGGEVRLLDTPGGGLTVELEFPTAGRVSTG